MLIEGKRTAIGYSSDFILVNFSFSEALRRR